MRHFRKSLRFFIENQSFNTPNTLNNWCFKVDVSSINEKEDYSNEEFNIHVTTGTIYKEIFIPTKIILRNIIFKNFTFQIRKEKIKYFIDFYLIQNNNIEKVNYEINLCGIEETLKDIVRTANRLSHWIESGFYIEEYGNFLENNFFFNKCKIFDIFETIEFYKSFEITGLTNKRTQHCYHKYVKNLPKDIYLIGLILDITNKEKLKEIYLNLCENDGKMILYNTECGSDERTPGDEVMELTATREYINKRIGIISCIEKYNLDKHKMYNRFQNFIDKLNK